VSAIETYARTLARAAQMVGGEKDLAARLGVPHLLLAEWITGRKAPPQRMFLAAVDIVMEHSLQQEAAAPKDGAPTRPLESNGG
jgi:hypothetical protein